MEEGTIASSEAPVMKTLIVRPLKETNGDLAQVEKEGKKEEEEANFDGEFIKVEKESLDVKDGSDVAKKIILHAEKRADTERSLPDSSRDLLVTQEKVKELEFELEKVAGALKHSESENSMLKEEILLKNEKLEESGKQYDELELSQKKFQDQIIQAEEKHSLVVNDLQQALQAQEAKDKELAEVKEAFNGLSIELENSRKKWQDLEHELQYSVGEAKKFEELHKQSGLHAESEMQRALELERLLEAAKVSAKEIEDQLASREEELKGLYEKIAHNQNVEVTLQNTVLELSTVQNELVTSKSLMLDLEQKHASKEALMEELTQELNLIKASDSRGKEDMLVLENLLAATKQDLESKISELDGIKLKLQEEVQAKELVEAGLKAQEAKFSSLQEELDILLEEKKNLVLEAGALSMFAEQKEDLCKDLSEKLKITNESYRGLESHLSEALSNNTELENKLKSLEEFQNDSGAALTAATQKNIELEDMLRASNEAAEDSKSKLRELKTRFIATEQRNVELEQQLNLLELKCSDAEGELKEFSAKISELTTKLGEVEQEKNMLNDQMEEYQIKVGQLESALNQSALQNSELENELKSAVNKNVEHEDRATMNHQRSLELEDLFQTSSSKLEDAGKKVNELELLLEAEKYRIQELEEQISTLQKKREDAEAESTKFSGKASELASELEAFQAKASSLEIALQMANEKEKELTECLNEAAEEKKRFEEASNSSSAKLSEAENLVEVLRAELNLTQENFASIDNELKALSLRENELMEKLKSAEELLEKQGGLLEQASARNSELESLHVSLARESEFKVQEAMASFTSKDSEVKFLSEKLNILENQVKAYEEQIAEWASKSASFKEELDQSLINLASLESINEQLKRDISEAENKASQSLSENELLVETNIQLKSRVEEHQELLNSTISEKETAAQQIASHMFTIAELTDQHSKASELYAAAEARILEAEAQINEAIEKYTKRDSEANSLNEKLSALEGQIKMYEEKVHEASTMAETRNSDLEETLVKLKNLEAIVGELQSRSGHFEAESQGLAEANLKLNQELAMYESKLAGLEGKLLTAVNEKDETAEQLHSSKKAIEELTQQITSEEQRLQSKISSLVEENNLLNETHQNTKKELQALILELEGKLEESKANEDALISEIENFKAEMAEKSILQTRVKELEEQLVRVETQLKEEVESVKVAASEREIDLTSMLEDHARKASDREVMNEKILQLERDLQLAQTTIAEQNQQKEADSQKELEQKAVLARSLEELEAKNKQVVLIETEIKELKQKLELAEAKKGEGEIHAELKEGTEVKSRDIGATLSSPSKRKSKKRLEAAATAAQASSSSTQVAHTDQASLLTSLKFIFGVALISVIAGIILGKRY